MKNTFTFKATAFILWGGLLAFGFYLAQLKPLWNDELFTQTETIERSTYLQILTGDINEGNNAPLFYLIQKTFLALTHYRFPLKWQREWEVSEPSSQFILRITSNIAISASLAGIFYFFAKNYSWLAAILSLAISFSSYMVYAYWVEARPYSLWILLTTAQMIFFLQNLENDGRASWLRLVVTHTLLALTAFSSVFQIAAASGLLWIFKKGKPSRYIFSTILPLALAVVYYLRSPRFQFFFNDTVPNLILVNYPLERMGLWLAFGLFAFFYFLKRKKGNLLHRESALEKDGAFFIFTGLMILAAFCIGGILKLGDTGGPRGFEVSSRYFIFLVPFDIIATTFFAMEFLKNFCTQRWLKLNFLMILVGLIVLRFVRVIATLTILEIY